MHSASKEERGEGRQTQRKMNATLVLTDDEGHPTTTSQQQIECENSVLETFLNCEQGLEEIRLNREKHTKFCSKALLKLPRRFVALDASRWAFPS